VRWERPKIKRFAEENEKKKNAARDAQESRVGLVEACGTPGRKVEPMPSGLLLYRARLFLF
jgi:hypothetical protein